jgi:hypothetical protein
MKDNLIFLSWNIIFSINTVANTCGRRRVLWVMHAVPSSYQTSLVVVFLDATSCSLPPSTACAVVIVVIFRLLSFLFFFFFSLSSQNKFSPYFFFFYFFFTLLHNGYFFNLFLSILIWHILFFSNLVLICLNFLFYFWPFCESIVYFQINPQF